MSVSGEFTAAGFPITTYFQHDDQQRYGVIVGWLSTGDGRLVPVAATLEFGEVTDQSAGKQKPSELIAIESEWRLTSFS